MKVNGQAKHKEHTICLHTVELSTYIWTLCVVCIENIILIILIFSSRIFLFFSYFKYIIVDCEHVAFEHSFVTLYDLHAELRATNVCAQ